MDRPSNYFMRAPELDRQLLSPLSRILSPCIVSEWVGGLCGTCICQAYLAESWFINLPWLMMSISIQHVAGKNACVSNVCTHVCVRDAGRRKQACLCGLPVLKYMQVWTCVWTFVQASRICVCMSTTSTPLLHDSVRPPPLHFLSLRHTQPSLPSFKNILSSFLSIQ